MNEKGLKITTLIAAQVFEKLKLFRPEMRNRIVTNLCILVDAADEIAKCETREEKDELLERVLDELDELGVEGD